MSGTVHLAAVYEGIPATRTLARAAEICGGVQALARILRVPVPDLSAWIAGTAATPMEVYLRALEFVARTRLNKKD